MLSYAPFSFLLIYISLAIPSTAAVAPAYNATDLILLNCGEPSNLNDTSSRVWSGDQRSRYVNAATKSSASRASYMHPAVFPVPYQTARVFHSPFTYTFPVTAGSKFLRLYFYPDVYSSFNTCQSLFSLTANSFTLLHNFSAFLHSHSSPRPSFMKEFVVNVQGNGEVLVLTFSPNPNSFAFVNGIEIVSIPDKLYFKGNDVGIKFLDQMNAQLYYLDHNTSALENVYRLNVGGGSVDIADDRRGMFRAWSPDNDYIYFADHGWTSQAQGEHLHIHYTAQTPPYSAPAIVYITAREMTSLSISLEWGFPIDSGFYYLLRLHFCEFMNDVTKVNQRVFTISINNQTAESGADVISFAGGPDIPIFRDYIIWVPDDGHRGKQDLRLSMFPNHDSRPEYYSALLNGLEIFKLSDSNRSFAAPNPELQIDSSPPTPPVSQKKGRGTRVVYAYTGIMLGVLAVVTVAAFLIFRWRRKAKCSPTTSASWVLLSIGLRRVKRTSGSDVALPSDLCRYFFLDEIKAATGIFDEASVIGKGGFGKVYKGEIDDGGGGGCTTVAIKRLGISSKQGVREFVNEIKLLSKLRHLNLVPLVGYCDEYGEMILVYDYMPNGTLRSHLYNTENPPLTWKQRLQICSDAAKGLHYLHTGAEHPIIHRDVKSSNILLDKKWVAKMSDFGLSRVLPSGGEHAHVSTAVKGSIGYVDPEYCRRRQLTEKSDVYSFGVVLFEVLCARAAMVNSLPKEEVNLAEWGKICVGERRVEQIIDSNLKGQIAPQCLSKFVETAVACLGGDGADRPAMSDVVWSLEFAMQLQEEAESGGGRVVDSDGGSSDRFQECRSLVDKF